MALPPAGELSIFMGLILALSLYALVVSGHFPAEFRNPSLKTAGGKTVLWSTIAAASLVAIAAIAVARLLPLYATIIGGGAMVLLAPLLLAPLPDSFVNGRRALIAFAAIALALALLARHFIS